MTLLHGLLALLIVFLVAPIGSRANHHVCSWRIGPTSPFLYGYQRFCVADAAKSLADQIDWRCARDFGEEKHGVLIADFNVLRPGVLEIRTPCGGDGFAVGLDRAYDCDNYPYWAVCSGPADETQLTSSFECYYLYARDDCEWPKKLVFNQTTPEHLDVYHWEDKSWYPPHGPPSPPYGPPAAAQDQVTERTGAGLGSEPLHGGGED